MIHSYSVGMPGLMTYQVPFPLSFLASMSREIAKDIEDLVGDREGGAEPPLRTSEEQMTFNRDDSFHGTGQ